MSCPCNSFEICVENKEFSGKYLQIFTVLRKLTKLLESKILSCSTGRALELFDYYFRLEPQAHFVNDYPFVCSLLELIPIRMNENEVFEEYYEKYLQLCNIPPLMLRSSEKLTCDSDLKEFFTVFGGLLFYLKKDKHKFMVLDSLESILSDTVEYPRCFVSLDKLKNAAAESLLPRIIAKFLTFQSDEMFRKLLRIGILLAKASNKTSEKMIEEGAINSVLMHLGFSCPSKTDNSQTGTTMTDLQLSHYEEISTLVWLLLGSLKNFSSEKIQTFPSPFRSMFRSLRCALKFFYTNKRCRIDRNNIVAILLKIVGFFSSTEFIRSGLAEDIIQLNLAVENANIISEWSGIQITPCVEDFIFVRLLLMFLYYFNRPEYYGAVHFLRNTAIIGLKMKLVTHSQPVKWHRDQLGKLISIGMSVFAQTAIYTLEVILAEKGIIKFMDILIEKDHNVDVYLSLFRSLIIMARIDEIKSKMVLNRLLDIRAQFTMIGYCEAILSKEALYIKDQLSIAYSFAILEILFKRKTNLSNKRFMDLAMALLKRIRSPSEKDPFIMPQLPIMILSCLWNILLCDEQNLKQFIEEEGVYICLDLAETSVWPVKVVSLGLLTEVCEESSAIPFFVTWRNKKHQSILPFLFDIFRKENKLLGVKHTTNGLITDIEQPLMGIEQYKYICDTRHTLEDSPSISDMIGSCRPKIYAILHMITFVHDELVKKVNEIYKIGNQDMGLEDQITRVIVENFFALKIAEVWQELQLHFERCNIRPIADNYEMLSQIIRRTKTWGALIQDAQRKIIRIDREKEMIEENIFYMDLREARLNQTLSAYSELEYIARCTKDIYRMRSKRKGNLYLMENTIHKSDAKTLYHTTFMYDIMVNPVFDQILHISYINNVPQGHAEMRGPLTPRMRKAMVKYHKVKSEEMPSITNDELWGSIAEESCIK